MDKQKFSKILDRLLEKTKEETLGWERTVNIDTFLAALQDTAVSITKVNDNRYIFDFRNEMGEVIDSEIVLPSGREEIEDNPFKETEYGKSKNIFDLARKQSLKPEQTLDRILEQLAA